MKKLIKSCALFFLCFMLNYPSLIAFPNDDYTSEKNSCRKRERDNRYDSEITVFARNVREKVKIDHKINISNEQRALCFMVKPEDERTLETGHAILAVLGGTEEMPEFWAADLWTKNPDPWSVCCGSTFGTVPGLVRTTDSHQSQMFLLNHTDSSTCMGFSKWKYKTLLLSGEEFNELKENIKINQTEGKIPYYNFINANGGLNCSEFVLDHCKKINKDFNPNNRMYLPGTNISVPAFIDRESPLSQIEGVLFVTTQIGRLINEHIVQAQINRVRDFFCNATFVMGSFLCNMIK